MHPLVLAYRATDYVVFAGKQEIALRVGRPERSVDRLLANAHAPTAAFVTAWNPFSRLLSGGVNRSRQAQFEAELRARGIRYLHGEGRSTRGDWTSEQSVLMFNVSRQAVASLGRRWGQNAIVSLHPR
jgi:Protein of unknown function (DUF3293)